MLPYRCNVRELDKFVGERFCGFSLIENLITVVILSLGLLGLSQMQGHAFRISSWASMESAAVSLVSDIADRVRANPDAVNDYIQGTAVKNASCTSGGCSAQQMAGNDLWEWQQALARILPLGKGNICRSSIARATGGTAINAATDMCSGTGDRVFIWVQWDRNGDGILDNPPQFKLNGDMYFYVSVIP